MPVQFWKKATYGIAVATAAAVTASLGLAPAIAAPIPAPVALIPVPCSGPALNTAVATAPPSSVLALAPECTYVLAHGLPAIGDTLGFQGPATISLSEHITDPNGSILTVGAGGDVTTDLVSFADGDASSDPGSGGAIYNDGGTVQVYFGSFSHNNAAAYGGAIYSADGLLNVFRATFIDNVAKQGGAIVNHGTAAISGARFVANTAAGFGGAIENEGVADIHSSTFRANTAYSGGAAYNKNGSLVILDTNFTDNQAVFDVAMVPKSDTIEPPSGAGVANRARMTLKGDSFDDNGGKQTTKGGGVYNDGTATLTDSTLWGNHSIAGGGFYNDARAKLTGDTIRANSTAHDGGGIYNFGHITVSETRIHGNHAGLDGGGMLNGAFAKISDSQIYLNSAGIGGGGIHDYYSLKLTDTVLRDNSPNNCESRRGAKGCIRWPRLGAR
jgi:predicted outer membrane repeat protein